MTEKETLVKEAKCEFCGRTRGSEHTGKCPKFTLAAGTPTCPNPHCQATKDKWIGHQVRGVYDGVLFWECVKCGTVWARNFGTSYMNAKAQSAVNEFLVKIRGVELETGTE